MPKGHSNLIPVVNALVEQNAQMQQQLLTLEGALQIAQQFGLSQQKLLDEMLYRLCRLEERFKEYRDGAPVPSYQPQFEKWPSNGRS
jgi:hypothetical protein